MPTQRLPSRHDYQPPRRPSPSSPSPRLAASRPDSRVRQDRHLLAPLAAVNASSVVGAAVSSRASRSCLERTAFADQDDGDDGDEKPSSGGTSYRLEPPHSGRRIGTTPSSDSGRRSRDPSTLPPRAKAMGRSDRAHGYASYCGSDSRYSAGDAARGVTSEAAAGGASSPEPVDESSSAYFAPLDPHARR